MPLPCVRLEPHDCAVLFGQPAEKPAVTGSDFDHPRSRRKWAERPEDCSLPEAAQRLEHSVDDSGRLGVGAAAVQPSCVSLGSGRPSQPCRTTGSDRGGREALSPAGQCGVR